MINKSYVIAAAFFTTALLGANAAEAGCKKGFCTSGYYVGNQRWVDFTTSLSGYTHFNVFNGLEQIELGRNQRSFSLRQTGSNPRSYVYRIQACVKGDIFSKSSCTPWVTFKHADKE